MLGLSARFKRGFSTMDPYRILGIKPNATEKEIKEAYRKQCLRYHPDRNPSNKEDSEKKFKEMSEAYRMLMDPRQRERSGSSSDSSPRADAGGGFSPRGKPFGDMQFPGGFGFSFRGGKINLEDMFGSFHQGFGEATTIKEEIIMKNGRPWKKKITKTFKTSKGTRTEIFDENI